MENFREKNLPYRSFVRHRADVYSARDSIRSFVASRGCSRSRFTSQKEKQIQAQEDQKDFEGPPRQSQTKARLARISRLETVFLLNGVMRFARRGVEIRVPGTKTKTGSQAAPRFSAFFIAVAALLSASGGTHRVRGVMSAVRLLSPVESSSPPVLIELQFPSTPMWNLWQARPHDPRRQGILQRQLYIRVLLPTHHDGKKRLAYLTKRPSRS